MLIELGPDGLTYSRLADTSDDFQTNWETVRHILTAAARPLTRQEILDAWWVGLTKPHEATLWRWLERAVGLGLAVRTAEGTKTEPHRYGVVETQRESA
jgi:hypothetical protein